MAKTPAEIGSLAREACPQAINTLRGIMNSKKAPQAARIAASNSLLDRGLGKAAQAVTIDVNVKVTAITRRIVDAIDVDCDVVEPGLITQDKSGT